MSEADLTVSFAHRHVTPDYFLIIEQEPWGKDVGKTTILQAIAAMQTVIYGSSMPTLNCGGANGKFRTRVFVYPSAPDAAFQFKLSNGFVISATVEFAIREEIIQASMELKQTTDYPVFSVISSAWLGKCYDNQGNTVNPPGAEIESNVITFDKKVYGSLSIRYRVKRWVYVLEIRKRQLAIENTYQSLAYAVYNGGVEWCDVEAPAGFEESDGACQNGDIFGYMEDLNNWLNGRIGHVNVCHHRYRTVPVAAYANRKIEVDYCTQEINSDETTERIDTGPEEIECT